MITLLHGTEAFLVDRALQRVVGAERAQLTSAFNFEALAATASVEALRQAVLTPPFLDAQRLVEWKDPLLLTDARRGRAEVAEQLAAVAQEVPAEVHLVVALHRTLAPSHPFLKACQGLKGMGRAAIERYDPPRRQELASWVQHEAGQLGLKLSRDGSAELIRRSEPELAILHQELEKVALFADPNQVVGADQIKQVVADNRLHKIFALTDALAEPGSLSALRLLGQLYAEGNADAYVHFMLTQHFLRLLQVRLLQDEGAGRDAVLGKLGRTYAVEKAYDQAARWDAGRLQSALRALYDLEWAVKSGQTEWEAALEAFVFRLGAGELSKSAT
jgi:DNA polymerase-3 subunit delta